MGIGSWLKDKAKELDPTDEIKSLNEERKRLYDNTLNRGGSDDRARNAVLAIEEDMRRYVEEGPEASERTYSQFELNEGPAAYWLVSQGQSPSDYIGTEFDKKIGEDLANRIADGIEVPEGSYLEDRQLNPTGQPSILDPTFSNSQSEYSPNAIDFSESNPFAKFAHQAGFSDFADYQPPVQSANEGSQLAQALRDFRGNVDELSGKAPSQRDVLTGIREGLGGLSDALRGLGTSGGDE